MSMYARYVPVHLCVLHENIDAENFHATHWEETGKKVSKSNGAETRTTTTITAINNNERNAILNILIIYV